MAIGLFFVWPLIVCLMAGWIVPLLQGIRRRRRGDGGRALIGVGVAWAVAVSCLAGGVCWKIHSDRQKLPKVFDAAVCRMPAGTVGFEHGGDGVVMFWQSDSHGDKPRYWRTFVVNGVATFPAGHIKLEREAFQGLFRYWADDAGAAFTFEAGGRHEVLGSCPLSASVKAAPCGDGQLSLGFSLVDTAGNRVVAYALHAQVPGFEAVSPDGVCFGRGRFEYGEEDAWRARWPVPADAPPSFILRPVLDPLPFDVSAEETRWPEE